MRFGRTAGIEETAIRLFHNRAIPGTAWGGSQGVDGTGILSSLLSRASEQEWAELEESDLSDDPRKEYAKSASVSER